MPSSNYISCLDIGSLDDKNTIKGEWIIIWQIDWDTIRNGALDISNEMGYTYVAMTESIGFRNMNMNYVVDVIQRMRKNTESQTFINNRYFMPVVHQPWQLSKTVFLSQLFIMYLNKTNTQLVRFIVNVFKFLQSFSTSLAFGLVWNIIKILC